MIAAVKVVFPWSTCPIVPTFTWGLLQQKNTIIKPISKPIQNQWERNSLSSKCSHRSPQRSSETWRRRQIISSDWMRDRGRRRRSNWTTAAWVDLRGEGKNPLRGRVTKSDGSHFESTQEEVRLGVLVACEGFCYFISYNPTRPG